MAYNGGYAGTMYNSPIGRFYNPSSAISTSVVYSHIGKTYIGGIAYHSPSSSFNNKVQDKMFDIRAEKNIELYAPFDDYLMTSVSGSYDTPRMRSPKIIFSPNDFLKAHRTMTRWVGNFNEVKEIVEKIFKKVTGKELPNVEINIVSQQELFKQYGISGKKADEALQGFYCNGRIFVKEGRLDEMILTLGHELGHASSLSLANPELEEAKAYAFTEGWVKAIIKSDIEGLSQCIERTRTRSMIPEWAQVHLNGYKAFKERLDNGLSPMDIIENLTALDRTHLI